MKALIVHAHPEPKSFNGALKNVAVERLERDGHEVKISDLYEMKYNPVSDRRNFTSVKDASYFKQQAEEMLAYENHSFAQDVQGEIDKLLWCDTLILQFPLWWFGVPAIMKGWADKTFAMGATYGLGQIYDKGKFVGRRALASTTTGGAEELYSRDGLAGDMEQVLRPVTIGMFAFLGFTPVPSHVVYQPAHLSDEQRKQELEKYSDHVAKIWDMKPLEIKPLALAK